MDRGSSSYTATIRCAWLTPTSRTRNATSASWKHPRSNHWHQLDLVITKRHSLNSLCNTRAYHSTDCDTDNSLIASKIKLKRKELHCSKKKSLRRLTPARPGTQRRIGSSWKGSKNSCPATNHRLQKKARSLFRTQSTVPHSWQMARRSSRKQTGLMLTLRP